MAIRVLDTENSVSAGKKKKSLQIVEDDALLPVWVPPSLTWTDAGTVAMPLFNDSYLWSD